MKKMNRILASFLVLLVITASLCGCKAENTQKTETNLKVEGTETLVTEETETEDATFLVNEGDAVIVVPEDQDMGGG